MNYRGLLIRYIAHVKANEGIDFIEDSFADVEGLLSEDEWRELRALADIVRNAEIAAGVAVLKMKGSERAATYADVLRKHLGSQP